MTEDLFMKLEERIMTLLTEVENLRKCIAHLQNENREMKVEREKHEMKLHDMLSILDAVNIVDNNVGLNMSNVKPVLIQG